MESYAGNLAMNINSVGYSGMVHTARRAFDLTFAAVHLVSGGSAQSGAGSCALIAFMMPGKPAIILQSNGRVCCFDSMIELRQHCEKVVRCSVSPGRTSYQTVRVYNSQATCSASKLQQQSYRAELTRLSKELYKDSKWKPRQQQGQQVVALPLSCLSRMNSAKEYTNALEFAFDESMGVAVAYRGRNHTKDAWLMFSTSSAFSNKNLETNEL